MYFGIVRNVGEDRFELHCCHKKQDVVRTDALSKSVPCTEYHRTETIPAWRHEMIDRFGAIEVTTFETEVTL